MNLIDCYVTKILDKPYEKYGKVWLKVEYEDNGYVFPVTTILMLDSIREADTIHVGYCFQQ